jgi:hypothetical protein
MSLDEEKSEDNASTRFKSRMKKSWEELVAEQAKKKKLVGATCPIYSKQEEDTVDQTTLCVCGRLASRHSFTGKPKEKFRKAEKWGLKLAEAVSLTEYGQMNNGARVCNYLIQVLCNDFKLISF